MKALLGLSGCSSLGKAYVGCRSSIGTEPGVVNVEMVYFVIKKKKKRQEENLSALGLSCFGGAVERAPGLSGDISVCL